MKLSAVISVALIFAFLPVQSTFAKTKEPVSDPEPVYYEMPDPENDQDVIIDFARALEGTDGTPQDLIRKEGAKKQK